MSVMRLVLLILMLSAVSWGAVCTPAQGFANCESLTINHTKVPGNLTNYPAGLCFDVSMGTNCLVNTKQLATVANGGSLLNAANGFDFIFTSDSAGTMTLAYEAKFHNLTTGAAEIWVNVPTVSSAVDTTIYMFYGKASVVTDQSNVAGTWDANFLIVYHFDNLTGSSTTTLTDSIGNFSLPAGRLFNGGTYGGSGTGLTGSIGAANFFFNFFQGGYSGADGTYAGFPTGTNPKTLECWINTFAGNIAERDAFSWGGTGVGAGFALSLFTNAGTAYWGLSSSTTNQAFAGRLAAGFFNDGNFHHIAIAYPSGGTTFNNIKVYLDGTSGANDFNLNGATVPVSTSVNFHMACGVNCNGDWLPNNLINTDVDECRVSNIERSANWLTTEYNNISNPVTFWSNSTGGNNVSGRTIIVN